MTKLEQARIGKGLTQEAIASKVGIAVSTYSMYENGLRSIPRLIAESIAETVGCEVKEICLKNSQLAKVSNPRPLRSQADRDGEGR